MPKHSINAVPMAVSYVSHMGNDDSVVNAARVSFAKAAENYTPAQNSKLITYLAMHHHWTPFAHTAITLRCKAPVPIRTQCFKHKQGLVENEESRRYITSTPEYYIPDFYLAPENAKQGRSQDRHPDNDFWRSRYSRHLVKSISLYEEMIAEGVAPEQARMVLPQGVQVNWIWTGSVYAFANFVKKRSHPTAQYEVQVMAELVNDIIEPLYPVSWKALMSS